MSMRGHNDHLWARARYRRAENERLRLSGFRFVADGDPRKPLEEEAVEPNLEHEFEARLRELQED